jgi:hypothetical protein
LYHDDKVLDLDGGLTLLWVVHVLVQMDLQVLGVYYFVSWNLEKPLGQALV